MGHVRDACSGGRLDLVAEDEFDEPSDLPAHEDGELHPLLKEFPKVFDDQLGCFTGEPVSIVVDPDATPRFFKARPVPLAYRQRVDEELERQICDTPTLL
ncbi:hypothetical protein FJT64_026004 [Amphibalanus amphitrite]|uniref:Uncharacterized protein n=1 Tax=Amphibalanus amphitrite TaxID=1232801 RepID=A0A6A4W390_AMPAM|nr:hypothetical protein FJT64_026004 [Amphibalanus amphitrite]